MPRSHTYVKTRASTQRERRVRAHNATASPGLALHAKFCVLALAHPLVHASDACDCVLCAWWHARASRCECARPSGACHTQLRKSTSRAQVHARRACCLATRARRSASWLHTVRVPFHPARTARAQRAAHRWAYHYSTQRFYKALFIFCFDAHACLQSLLRLFRSEGPSSTSRQLRVALGSSVFIKACRPFLADTPSSGHEALMPMLDARRSTTALPLHDGRTASPRRKFSSGGDDVVTVALAERRRRVQRIGTRPGVVLVGGYPRRVVEDAELAQRGEDLDAALDLDALLGEQPLLVAHEAVAAGAVGAAGQLLGDGAPAHVVDEHALVDDALLLLGPHVAVLLARQNGGLGLGVRLGALAAAALLLDALLQPLPAHADRVVRAARQKLL
mmetsp:Transcript_23970/g.50284  ORF Transcript_23970/g.50284 Transcript_23970/m.50284 type:complete len:391 (+) Transcript_23970:485-1657(+)